MSLNNCIRERRIGKKLSVEKLAQEVGVTRQALWTIESGKVSPSATVALRLAKVLNTPVEHLFWETPELRTTYVAENPKFGKELPERAYVGKIGGRPVARFMSEKDGYGRLMSCAQGVVRSGIDKQGQIKLELLGDTERMERTLFVSGCDLGLGLFSAYPRQVYRRGEGIWFNVTNQTALQELSHGETHIAAIHIRTDEQPSTRRKPRSNGENSLMSEWVSEECNQYLFASEQIGWILPRGNPKGFQNAGDLTSGRFSLVNRPPGAGARSVLDEQLREANVSLNRLPGYNKLASGHYEVAEMISRGLADVGVGHASAAALLGLHFIPIHEEQCWLVIPKAYEQLEPVQSALDILHSDTFRTELRSFAPYDVQRMGQTRE